MTYAKSPGALETRQLRWLALCTGILLLGAALRLVALADVPPGLAQDEVLNADIVSFIRGGEHAFFFRHGYGHEPLYHYWSVPFQVLLGDNFLSIRLPAVCLGMILIALVLRWSRRDFGTVVGLVAGFGIAVSWWPVIFSRVGLRPIMEPVFLVCVALVWPRARKLGSQRGILLAAAAGLLLGITLYTYTAARVLFALPAIYGAYCWLMSWTTSRRLPSSRQGSTGADQSAYSYRQQAIYAMLALVVMAAVALPLFLTLRADPTLQQRVDQLSGPLDALQEGEIRPILTTSLATLGYFGVTGDPRWTYSLPDRPLFEPVAALLFLGGLAVALWRWRNPVYGFLLVWLLVGIIPSMATPDAPSSVRLVGAMPVVYVLPGLAVALAVDWVRRHGENRHTATTLVAIGLLAVGLLAIGRTVLDGFVRWPAALDARLKYQTVLRDISRDDRLSQSAPVVADGFYEPIDDDSLRRNYNGNPEARWVQSGEEGSGALVWPEQAAEGDKVVYRVFVPEFAPLDEALLAWAGYVGEPERSDSRPSYAIYELPTPPSPVSVPVTFARDGHAVIALQGVFESPPVQNDQDSGHIILYSDWEVMDSLPDDLAIFVHLLDASGQVVAQFDGLDAAAETLRSGDRVLQKHVLIVPDLSDEPLTLQIGFYQRSDGSRLELADGTDSAIIGTCQVQTHEGSQSSVTCDLPTQW